MNLVAMLICLIALAFAPTINAQTPINQVNPEFRPIEFVVDGFFDAGHPVQGANCDFKRFGRAAGPLAPVEFPRLTIEDASGTIVAVRELRTGTVSTSDQVPLYEWACRDTFTLHLHGSMFYRLTIPDRLDRPLSMGELFANETYQIYLGKPEPLFRG